MTPWFIATEPFAPECGETWDAYIAGSRLTQLQELVCLDGILCPTILPETRDEYRPHIVNESFLLNFFVDYDFLSERPSAPGFADFRFLGYDLVEKEGTVSALTKCGGFPDVFDNAEISPVGLLTDLDRATEVQSRLHSLYPDEHHADCTVWAIFRLVGR